MIFSFHKIERNLSSIKIGPLENDAWFRYRRIVRKQTSFYLKAYIFVLYRFPEYLKSGLLELIAPPAEFYPDFNDIKQTYGDTKERVK